MAPKTLSLQKSALPDPWLPTQEELLSWPVHAKLLGTGWKIEEFVELAGIVSSGVSTSQGASTQVVWLSQNSSFELLESLSSLPVNVRREGFCDWLSRGSGQNWYPHQQFEVSFRQLLSSQVLHLSTRSVGYVSGRGSWARHGLSVLSRLGFERLVWITPESMPTNWQQELGLWSTQIEIVPSHQLSLRPNDGSCLLSFEDLAQQKELAQDLSYLNFLQTGGLVLEASLVEEESPLVQEAKNLGLRLITRKQILQKSLELLLLNSVLGPGG